MDAALTIPDGPERVGGLTLAFTRDQRIATAGVVLIESDLRKAAVLAKIDADLLKRWVGQPWWAQALREAEERYREEITAGYSAIVAAAQKEILDRIQNGDQKVVGDELTNVKVPAKELALVAAIAFDKRQALKGLPASAPSRETALSLAEKLRGKARTAEDDAAAKVAH